MPRAPSLAKAPCPMQYGNQDLNLGLSDDNACLFLTYYYLIISWWLLMKIRSYSQKKEMTLLHGKSCPHCLSLCHQTSQESTKRMNYEKMKMGHIWR
jgi:hypothetical protein